MTNRRWKISLLLLCLVLVTSLLLAACNHDDGELDYTVYVKSQGGLGLANVTVKITFPDATVEGQTDSTGKYVFHAPKGEYNVAVSNLPLGYSLAANNGYKTSADEATLTIYAVSSVITEEIPSNKVYKEGDVI